MRLPEWLLRTFRPQQPADRDVAVQRLASGTICVGLDLPRGVLFQAELLPEANANGTRLRLLLRPDVADRVGSVLGQASHALRRCP
jgi:hypothetical protein